MRDEQDIENLKKEYEDLDVPDELNLVIEKAIIKGKKHRSMVRQLAVSLPIAACFIFFAVLINYRGGLNIRSQRNNPDFPVVGSLSNLKNILAKSAGGSRSYNNSSIYNKSYNVNGTIGMADKSVEGAGSTDYSSTNVQVAGVDEADTVKTDGEYIYNIAADKVIITKAYPAKAMKKESEIAFTGVNPVDLYIYGKYMIVIGTMMDESNIRVYNGPIIAEDRYRLAAAPPGNTKIFIYNIEDKTKPEKIREIDMNAYYLSSRRIGGELYIIANKSFGFEGDNLSEDSEPQYKDSADGNKTIKISYDKIHYCTDAVESNYIMTAAFSLDDMKKAAKVSAVLGSGQYVYCSDKNLYLAAAALTKSEINTSIYKFSLSGGSVDFVAKGKIPGYILNQFSMDEQDGTLRIAACNNKDLTNNIYVLDKNMNIKGRLEGIAKGERIYSVRFMGERAYMVTFRATDPLFVIDLKDKTDPRLLGELKIPGYSNYLQPYDEDHLIGFGKAVEGMKLAMFDVTDVNKPVMEYEESIGYKTTESPVLYDPKALLFSKEKNILAFPVLVTAPKGKSGEVPVFQGVYIYNIDLQNGFKLKGKITHFPDGTNAYDLYNGDKEIKRILYIQDTLYTLSYRYIKANDLNTLQPEGSVDLQY